MSAKYLLPCSCGQKIPIELGQSGQTIPCSCGRQIDAPTMLEIRRLEEVEAEHAPLVRGGWGVRQGLALVGGVIVLVALCLMAGLHAVRPSRPKPPTPEQIVQIADHTDRLSLQQSYDLWKYLNHDLTTVPLVSLAIHEKKLAAHYRWMSAAGVVGGLGILCAASSLLVPRS